jgi:hypothetical protein
MTMYAPESGNLVSGQDARPAYDRLLGFFSYPLTFFVTGLLAVVVLQASLPTPRIGVDTLWQSELRLLIAMIAVIPAIVDMAVFNRRCCKLQLGPRFPAGQIFAAALVGAALAGLIAWSLGATLTLGLGLLAYVMTVVWIWVTGVVAAYFAGAVWHFRMERRRAFAAE